MHRTIIALATSVAVICTVAGCARELPVSESTTVKSEDGVAISNEKIKNHAFLQCMYEDEYFPTHLVDKGKQILLRLCERIEKERPADEAALYTLTHAATDDFNELAEEFFEADSEIETGARECIASDFDVIAKAYGFANADLEELIATRDW